ncbi:MAG TPA: FAD/NAD(P)-binding protein [Sedimentisphaerales bacterium]|jgi:NAD(P)H-flavin reductase|nr:FAD/NAD(P)-binding protein [Sedimentisphaerales bacterium]
MSDHQSCPECPNAYLPYPARIIRTLPQISDHQLFQIRFDDEQRAKDFTYRPGQFVMLSVVGTGEAPFSISSSPTRPGIIELCVRRIGHVTDALFRQPPNALVGVRGPYGNGFPIEKLEGNDLLLVAGGLGMAPLRSLLWYALDNRAKFKTVTLMYGARNPDEMLFKYELLSLVDRADVKCLLTVDKDASKMWKARVGVVTGLFDDLEIDPTHTYAAICGPDVMFRFVLEKLLERNFSKDRILMSLERNMQCGVGKCGHCMIGYKYTCLDGPIFTYWDAINLPEMI